MNHAGITSGCATCHDTGKSFTGVTNLKTKPTNHIPTHRGLRDLPRGGQLHELRRHADEPRRHRQRMHRPVTSSSNGHRLRRAMHRPKRRRAPDHPVTSADCSTCHTSDDVVQQRRDGRQAGQPHPDHGGVHAVPHQPDNLVTGGDEPQRHHQWLHDLPRGECHRDRLHRRDAEAAGDRAHPDDRRLRDLPQVDDELRRYGR